MNARLGKPALGLACLAAMRVTVTGIDEVTETVHGIYRAGADLLLRCSSENTENSYNNLISTPSCPSSGAFIAIIAFPPIAFTLSHLGTNVLSQDVFDKFNTCMRTRVRAHDAHIRARVMN